MKINLLLKNNEGYKWFYSDGIHVKGFLVGADNALIEGEQLIAFLLQTNGIIDLSKYHGYFCYVSAEADSVRILVDHMRSFPLFYIHTDSEVVVSDNAFYLYEYLHEPELEEKQKREFDCLGYLSGNETLVDGINQVEAGTYVDFSGGKYISSTVQAFYSYVDADARRMHSLPDGIFELMYEKYKAVIERLIVSAKNRTIVVPLSGGYDSRIIAVLLKRLNYEKVVCFSFGKKSSWEARVSKSIAKKLGYKWHFIEYSNSLWKQWFNSDAYLEYEYYSSNLSSIAHIQQWPAIKWLHDNEVINSDSVFVPGHSGDFLAGSHLKPELMVGNVTSNIVSENIYASHYNLWKREQKKYKYQFIEKINSVLARHKKITNDPILLTEIWNWQERQCKFITNENRNYEIFGYAWLMPLWDSELISFWQTIPNNERIARI